MKKEEFRDEDYRAIASVDIGSSLTKVVVARPISEFELEIIGVGTCPSTGIKNGAIVNVETTTRAIVEAVSDAELMAGEEIGPVLVNLSGKSLRSVNEKGIIAVASRDRTVAETDIHRVIEAAQSIHVPLDLEIIHVLSKEFKVDDQENIKDPVGMTGVRLECEVHIVLAGTTLVQNINRCVESAGLYQIDKVISGLASSEAVITQSERDLGVLLIDIGAGICDVIGFIDGGVSFSIVVPFGGANVTSDISIGLKTTIENAEILKKRYGHTLLNEIDPTEKIEIPQVSGRPSRLILRQELIEIIEPRMREIFEMIDTEISHAGIKPALSGGIILTGGGSLLGGIEVLAEDVFGLAVGRAKPAGLSGLADKVASPEFSTAIGLIKYAARAQMSERGNSQPRAMDKEKWSSKVKRWMEENL